MYKGNCLIAQSGGPTSAINATLCGVFKEAFQCNSINKIYGGINGIEGILQEKILDLTPILSEDRNLEILMRTPSASLGSCRYKLKDAKQNPAEFKHIFHIFEKYHIRYFFYIGGNDSMDTVMQLSQYAGEINYDINIIGLPKTIDNDLPGTDHTPGFGSCAKFVSTVLKEMALDNMVYDINSALVVEVMGRDTGWIALSTALARNLDDHPLCDFIYLPEVTFSEAFFIEDVKEALQHKKQLIIVVSEGVKNEDGAYLSSDDQNETDTFGHARLGGAGRYLADVIQREFNMKVRTIEFGLLQRCAAHIASAADINESYTIGRFGLQQALKGETGKMVSIRRISDDPYLIEYEMMKVDEIANKVKKVPLQYINKRRNNVSPLGLNYLKPLIQGTSPMITHDGMPLHLHLNGLYNTSLQNQ